MTIINIPEDKDQLYNEIELLEKTTRVESTSSVLNRDYTLAWTDSNLEMFADKQISCAELVVAVLKRLDKRINHEYLDAIKKKYKFEGEIEDAEDDLQKVMQDEFLELKKIKPDYGMQIKDILIGDVTNKIVFTRSHDGRVLKASIGGKNGTQTDNTQDKQIANTLKKVFGKEKKEEISE